MFRNFIDLEGLFRELPKYSYFRDKNKIYGKRIEVGKYLLRAKCKNTTKAKRLFHRMILSTPSIDMGNFILFTTDPIINSAKR